MGTVIVVGSINQDVFFRVPSLPGPGQTVLAADTYTGLGGKGANQAVAAARLGAGVLLLGAVGQDTGPDPRLALGEFGVDVSGVQRVSGAATGSAFVAVSDSGENQIVVASGANAALDLERLLDGLETRLRSAVPTGSPNRQDAESVTVVAQGELGGAVLERVVETVRRVSPELPAPATIVVNLAPAVPVSADVLRDVDVLVVNAGEAAELAAATGTELPPAAFDLGGDAAAACRRLADGWDVTTIVTLGGDGAVRADRLRPGVVVQRVAPVPDIVDTTGAGDCFVGALTAALAAGRSLPDALRWAVTSAACAVRGAGTMPSFPDAAAVARAVDATPLGVVTGTAVEV
ncbi:PfkB family carbohydrate kinase [Actinomadura sp. WMMA1423]|uniref:PfkB family carbohydrate kinase n=1 Tax=Actinomadura sp. WMMA1423 TaxID=2591108 RepID=UPI00143DF968|nr:PfkB family carbohydrate kinase [Actinomadura sp. WMMA1423]